MAGLLPSVYGGPSASRILTRVWVASPEERAVLRGYLDRVKVYRNECGCALGGVFGALVLLVLIVYDFGYGGFSLQHWFNDTARAIACLFAAVLIGKATGIGVARIRLVLLGRELRARYGAQGT
jgi:hypothetical protein